ncbi:hypothetical protein FS837_000871 [Tulasnella sp. UAMH 9824]|nr:hypothetical protein FS837_000871 [Tulasnella sp. UAMH 9824]
MTRHMAAKKGKGSKNANSLKITGSRAVATIVAGHMRVEVALTEFFYKQLIHVAQQSLDSTDPLNVRQLDDIGFVDFHMFSIANPFLECQSTEIPEVAVVPGNVFLQWDNQRKGLKRVLAPKFRSVVHPLRSPYVAFPVRLPAQSGGDWVLVVIHGSDCIFSEELRKPENLVQFGYMVLHARSAGTASKKISYKSLEAKVVAFVNASLQGVPGFTSELTSTATFQYPKIPCLAAADVQALQPAHLLRCLLNDPNRFWVDAMPGEEQPDVFDPQGRETGALAVALQNYVHLLIHLRAATAEWNRSQAAVAM